MGGHKIILGYLVSLNLFTLFISWTDKRASIKKKQRVSESTLLTLSLLGGSLGMLLSMKLFRHKTRKPKFYIGAPVILVLQLAGALYLFYRIK
ncbi:MAG: DUF1294 domain-containing protein [Clostridia bacterium]|nr:DUF1294 domain-containing protein [Clostridia bacterium]